MIGVRPDGTKDRGAGGRPGEHRQLGDRAAGPAARGMRAPVGAVGDGALGFWAAVRDVWPERANCDWCHKMGNVLEKRPAESEARPAHEHARRVRSQVSEGGHVPRHRP